MQNKDSLSFSYSMALGQLNASTPVRSPPKRQCQLVCRFEPLQTLWAFRLWALAPRCFAFDGTELKHGRTTGGLLQPKIVSFPLRAVCSRAVADRFEFAHLAIQKLLTVLTKWRLSLAIRSMPRCGFRGFTTCCKSWWAVAGTAQIL